MDKEAERKKKQLALMIAASKRNIERAKHEIAKKHLEIADYEASIEGEGMQQEQFEDMVALVEKGDDAPENIMEGLFGVDFNIGSDD